MTALACFYRVLDPRAQAALERYAPQAGLEVDWAETAGDGSQYAAELAKRWGKDDLILVEQDKEIYPETLPGLMSCGADWCACTYWLFPEPHTTLCVGGFGATRFSLEVQQFIAVEEFAGDGWLGIDRRFLEALKRHGIGCCLHSQVLHHHVYEPRPASVLRHVADLRARGMLPPAMYPQPAEPGLLPGSYRL